MTQDDPEKHVFVFAGMFKKRPSTLKYVKTNVQIILIEYQIRVLTDNFFFSKHIQLSSNPCIFLGSDTTVWRQIINVVLSESTHCVFHAIQLSIISLKCARCTRCAHFLLYFPKPNAQKLETQRMSLQSFPLSTGYVLILNIV